MKLLKYLFFILILIGSLIFLVELNTINTIGGIPITIKVPFLVDSSKYGNGFDVWIILLATLTMGVLLGFFIALFQIISQKSEVISIRAKLRRLKVELDNLRNQAIDDEIIIPEGLNTEVINNE